MQAVIIALLIVLIYLVSCDNSCVTALKERIFGSAEQTTVTTTEGFSAEDGYKLLPDALFKNKDSFMNSRESVPSWEPSTADFDKLRSDDIYKSYSEDLKANVDRAIVESHREYVDDSNFLATTGASHASDRDDFTPAVPFHGLPRSAHYRNLGSESTSRTSQSETPEEVIDNATHNTSGYEL